MSLFRIGATIRTARKLRRRETRTVRRAKDHQNGYAGRYVAVDPRIGHKIIAHGPKSNRVAAEARRAGVEVPVIIYVPEKDTASLYWMPIRDYPFIAVNPYAEEQSEVVRLGGPRARPYLWLRITNPAARHAMIVSAAMRMNQRFSILFPKQSYGLRLPRKPTRSVRGRSSPCASSISRCTQQSGSEMIKAEPRPVGGPASAPMAGQHSGGVPAEPYPLANLPTAIEMGLNARGRRKATVEVANSDH